jgi:carbonic anhydrase
MRSSRVSCQMALNIPKPSFVLISSISIRIGWLTPGYVHCQRCVALIDKLLLGNLRFREADFTPNIDYYKELAGSQHPETLWIGCSDSRLQTGHITQARAGELFIQSNIGNIVPVHDWNFATVLEYAVVHLKVKDVVVCGHSNCGAIRALDKESTDSYIPLWLNNAREAKTRVDAMIQPPETVLEKENRYRMIEQENVRLQIEHLHTYPLLKKAVDEKRVEVHGLYYDLGNGLLSRVK